MKSACIVQMKLCPCRRRENLNGKRTHQASEQSWCEKLNLRLDYHESLASFGSLSFYSNDNISMEMEHACALFQMETMGVVLCLPCTLYTSW